MLEPATRIPVVVPVEPKEQLLPVEADLVFPPVETPLARREREPVDAVRESFLPELPARIPADLVGHVRVVRDG